MNKKKPTAGWTSNYFFELRKLPPPMQWPRNPHGITLPASCGPRCTLWEPQTLSPSVLATFNRNRCVTSYCSKICPPTCARGHGREACILCALPSVMPGFASVHCTSLFLTVCSTRFFFAARGPSVLLLGLWKRGLRTEADYLKGRRDACQ